MIKLDKNYSIENDTTSGFKLLYKSDPIDKEVDGKIKTTYNKDMWYYPKLSQALEKYYTLNISVAPEKELLEKVIKVENNINNFSLTFAKKGKMFQL